MLSRPDVSQWAKHVAKSRDLDSQPHTVRLVNGSRSECTGKELASVNIAGPSLCQRACKCEQHGTLDEGDYRVSITHNVPACVYNERVRRQQRFDFFEKEVSLLTTRNQAR